MRESKREDSSGSRALTDGKSVSRELLCNTVRAEL